MVTKILKSETPTLSLSHTHTHTHTTHTQHTHVCRFRGKKANLSKEEINTPDCAPVPVWPESLALEGAGCAALGRPLVAALHHGHRHRRVLPSWCLGLSKDTKGEVYLISAGLVLPAETWKVTSVFLKVPLSVASDGDARKKWPVHCIYVV